MERIVHGPRKFAPLGAQMRFSILQLLLAVAMVGTAIGVGARDGLSVAFIMVLSVSLCIVCFVRARTHWPISNPAQKLYAAGTTMLSCVLLAFVVYSIGTSVTLARERNTRHLQASLAHDERFSRVQVEYFEGKGTWLTINGIVPTENDFQDLRKQLTFYDWRDVNLRWHVYVTDSRQSYDGWDKDLFGEPKP